jgi:hypothetical protein
VLSRVVQRCTLVLCLRENVETRSSSLPRKNEWSDAEVNEIQGLPQWQRKACRRCRYDYEIYVFQKRNPGDSDTVDDLLREEQTVKRLYDTMFRPSFYAGGVFDTKRNLENAYFLKMALVGLDSQLKAESTRYYIKHNSLVGYSPRFTFEEDFGKLFQAGSQTVFAEMARSPVGLNPERFVAACKSYHQWMLDCEYGVQYCEMCEMRRPAATCLLRRRGRN